MSAKAAWWLERIAADGSALAVPVQAVPFGIGRDDDNGLVLVTAGVSRRHASLELDASTGRLVLLDLGMEAIYEFEVKDMPVTVAVDSSGTSVHQTGPQEWAGKIGKIPVAAV